MSEPTLDALETVFRDVVDHIDRAEFDSHDFFLVLARRYQQLYAQALVTYAYNDQPFQTLHAHIAKRLKGHTELVTQIGVRNSPNIFGLSNEAAVWRKVA